MPDPSLAAGAWTALGSFLAGYLLILMAPGPNMLAVGCIAALRGLRGAVPLVAGLACGAAALALGVLLMLGAAPAKGAMAAAPATAVQAVAAGLLLCVAVAILRSPGPVPEAGPAVARRIPRQGIAAFLAGFGTALTNPVTAAYFASAMLGPDGHAAAGASLAARVLLPAAVVAPLVFLFWIGIAALLARPRVRQVVQARHRPIRIAAAGALAAMALPMLWPALSSGLLVGAALAGW